MSYASEQEGLEKRQWAYSDAIASDAEQARSLGRLRWEDTEEPNFSTMPFEQLERLAMEAQQRERDQFEKGNDHALPR